MDALNFRFINVSDSSMSISMINFISREFEIFELLSVLDHQFKVSRLMFGNVVVLSYFSSNTFLVEIIPFTNDVLIFTFSAVKIRKLHPILALRGFDLSFLSNI